MAQGKTSERTERLTIRMTPEEHKALKNAAAFAGLTVTSFVCAMAAGDHLGQMVLDGFERGKQLK